MHTSLFAALPKRAPSESEHLTKNLADLLTAAGYFDVRSRIGGYPSPRLHPQVLDMPDVTAVNLKGVHDVFYVLTDEHIGRSDLLRPWRTLLSGCGQRVRVWLAIPEGRRPVVQARLAAMGVQACVLEL